MTTDDPTAAIKQLAKAYAQGFLNNDVDAILDLFGDKIVVLTCDKPPIVERQVLHDTLSQELQAMQVIALECVPQEITLDKNTGYVWGLSSAEICTHPDEPHFHLQGKFLWIVEKDANQQWKLKRDCSIADL